jgi:hypothetical protein
VGRQEALRAERAETMDRHEATRAEGVARGRSGKHRKAPGALKSAGHLQIHLLLPFIPLTRRPKT